MFINTIIHKTWHLTWECFFFSSSHPHSLHIRLNRIKSEVAWTLSGYTFNWNERGVDGPLMESSFSGRRCERVSHKIKVWILFCLFCPVEKLSKHKMFKVVYSHGGTTVLRFIQQYLRIIVVGAAQRKRICAELKKNKKMKDFFKSTLMNMKSRIPCKKSCRLFKYRHQQLYFHVISHWLIGSLLLLLQPALCSGQHFLPTLASFCTFFLFESRCVFPARHQWALPVFWTMSLWFFSAGWGNPDSGLSGGSMSTERETLRLRQCVRRLSDVRWKTLAASSVWAGS